jgi:hypothetical protein
LHPRRPSLRTRHTGRAAWTLTRAGRICRILVSPPPATEKLSISTPNRGAWRCVLPSALPDLDPPRKAVPIVVVGVNGLPEPRPMPTRPGGSLGPPPHQPASVVGFPRNATKTNGWREKFLPGYGALDLGSSTQRRATNRIPQERRARTDNHPDSWPGGVRRTSRIHFTLSCRNGRGSLQRSTSSL